MIFRKIFILLFATFISIIYVSAQNGFSQLGRATYYHKKFEGRRTTSGERYHARLYTAAHRKLPFGTLVKVTNQRTGKWVIVRVNDRGPFVKGRIIDLSKSAARDLDLIRHSNQKVKIETINPADLNLKNEKPGEITEKPTDSKYFLLSVNESNPSGFGVQIASYSDMENLFLFYSRIEKSIKEKLSVQVSVVKGERVYRVIAGVLENKELAESLATKLAVDFPGCFCVQFVKQQ